MSHSDENLHVAPCIRHVWIDDRVAILDLQSECYFALDPTASLMWREFARGHDRDECLRSLRRRFPDETARLELDLDAFAKRCTEAGWLVGARCEPTPAEQRLPSYRPARRFLVLRAWWSLFRTTRLLSMRGFSWTYNLVSQRVHAHAMPAQDQDRTLRDAVTAFSRAEEFFHLRAAPADCLPRSLALFQFLCAVGLPVEHCIGIQQFPFSAHAWTQFHGQVVHDDPLNQERYTVIARVPT
jgi:hypothetical protein